jgi:hypothetical protein
LELGKRVEIAKDLHKQFYTALGRGEMKVLRTICCQGLVEAADKRIQQRKKTPHTLEPWTLNHYSGAQYPTWLMRWPLTPMLPNAACRVMSDKVSPLPFPDTYIRQCVVRIRSVQTYHMADAEYSQTGRHEENVVIQRITLRGEVGDWKIWGTTDPSTGEELDNLMTNKGSSSTTTLMDRLQEKMSTFQGSM